MIRYPRQMLIIVSAVIVAGVIAILSLVIRGDVQHFNFVRAVPGLKDLTQERERVVKKAILEELNFAMPDFMPLRQVVMDDADPAGRSFTEFKDYYGKVLRIWPDSADTHSMLGYAAYAEGDFEAAIRHYQSAMKMAPEYFWNAYNLGVILYELEKYEDAARMFTLAQTRDPLSSLRHLAGSKIYSQIFSDIDNFGETAEANLKSGYETAKKLALISMKRHSAPADPVLEPVFFRVRPTVRMF